MARFLLIDSSLRDTRGHHDAYARSVLTAAERFGYGAILAAHRDYRAAPLPPSWRLERLFNHTIYDDPLLMPDWGAPPGALDRWPARRNLAERWQALRHARLRRRLAASHAAGIASLARCMHLAPGDQAFFAAASELVLHGLAIAASTDRRLADVDWHCLFHFNNLLGLPGEYGWQSCRADRLRKLLAAVQQAVGDARLHVYATTAELAHEISSLGVVTVRELGYPIEAALRTCGEQPRRPGPLRITFAGDARLEKGFTHLPGIIQAVLADRSIAGGVQFVVQASFPFKLPCRRRNLPIVAAREALEGHDAGRVVVLREPLDEAAYRRLILDADIAILPYDARHYYARCSGVLVEMFSAGVPAIVPEKCWMESQIRAARDAGYAVGLAASLDDMPRRLIEIVRRHDEFRAGARRFARTWTHRHHPTRIVAEILSTASTLGYKLPRAAHNGRKSA